MESLDTTPVSPKSYGTSVALAGVFGVVGIHHFYLGNHLHGLFDCGLFVVSMGLLIGSDDPALIALGVVLLLIDIAHTVFVMYRLLVGEQRDASGLLVKYPGQA